DEVITDGQVSDKSRVALRLAANHAAESSVRAVDRCYKTAGGAAVYKRSPLQRVFRDVHVAAQHAMVSERIFEPIGRYRFGLDTDLRPL
ncbi:MAG: flavin-dependent monooxygenase, partial [Actinomycetota bacterium]|nr:flavin-dependent monooxygenase [Actinomycetota bacterium]